MAEKFPRLSKTLKPFTALGVCQNCGELKPSCSRWQEHDDSDRKQPILINLCDVCAKQIIKPHPRLYSELGKHTPFPGAMLICLDCKFRDGMRCSCPDAKYNGGPGVMLKVAEPIRALVDGPAYRGPMTIYRSPASACKQKVTDWPASEPQHPWQSGRDKFFKITMPLLEKHGKEIGAAHNAGDKVATEIINRYTMLQRSFDPLTAIVIEKELEKFIKREGKS